MDVQFQKSLFEILVPKISIWNYSKVLPIRLSSRLRFLEVFYLDFKVPLTII